MSYDILYGTVCARLWYHHLKKSTWPLFHNHELMMMTKWICSPIAEYGITGYATIEMKHLPEFSMILRIRVTLPVSRVSMPARKHLPGSIWCDWALIEVLLPLPLYKSQKKKKCLISMYPNAKIKTRKFRSLPANFNFIRFMRNIQI